MHVYDSKERRNPITKGGNASCRHALVQAACHGRHRPHISKVLRPRQQGQDRKVIAHAWRAQLRLYGSTACWPYKKRDHVAIVAMAPHRVADDAQAGTDAVGSSDDSCFIAG